VYVKEVLGLESTTHQCNYKYLTIKTMSIVTKNGDKFSFISDNGLETIAPKDVKVYVHVTDNGNGTHAINGKVIKETEGGATELGWVRTTETLPSDTEKLLVEAHVIVIAELVKLNTNVQFESTL
jgi:hypothetical protein